MNGWMFYIFRSDQIVDPANLSSKVLFEIEEKIL